MIDDRSLSIFLSIIDMVDDLDFSMDTSSMSTIVDDFYQQLLNGLITLDTYCHMKNDLPSACLSRLKYHIKRKIKNEFERRKKGRTSRKGVNLYRRYIFDNNQLAESMLSTGKVMKANSHKDKPKEDIQPEVNDTPVVENTGCELPDLVPQDRNHNVIMISEDEKSDSDDEDYVQQKRSYVHSKDKKRLSNEMKWRRSFRKYSSLF